ncbi:MULTISPECIES: 4-carboxy-4-hydroxy-2-oxoadipate aldolase/oxaloacetate decarboxylase [unclassified Saccharopolyspora]|uniref:4-carboxy-4-hydroxy-2-oxoadipate aldolase/oxaloacetate decarboxylase n=1 Tax=unclassified Saccharopolyspora TaxID=2646250 RepID=UPI001CD4F3D1|nr:MULTISPECIES: 4-carboxy-4-hydroxy-2-oxoadipate aldolase/oxaloacetate decarboxylase [unclassified Saccharopolyspora]MCA1187343.1 4-carboxy-4-hydroxy-2-oxoadipate aldolase/oxaloacetate decarboxylase [Saccharopolyspora sp. 6T]MCA1228853.1 4-carboxy-4-hydroxy-2-oxoadipate aldolase/oxaloacetate decarboxylase [Saccharopolyspora sp. 6M]
MIHVRTKLNRPAADVVAALGEYSAATIHEAQGRKGALSHRLKPVSSEMSFCGPAFTVSAHPGDNIMVQVAISYARPGDVVITAAGELEQSGSFGDVLATACQSKGLAAFVTDSGVRDSADLRRLGFPVFSGSVCIEGTVKETLGQVNQPISVGGQLVRPGDVLRGDADGIVVVDPLEAEEVVRLCREREEHEAGIREQHRRGDRALIEVHGLVDKLAAKGLVVDE